MKRFLSTMLSLILFLGYLTIKSEVTVFASSNVAAGITPTSSAPLVNPSRLTDGDKTASKYTTTNYNGLQWVQLDLGATCDVNDIKLWHYYGDGRRYHDVIVRLSSDSTFSRGVTTVFNNDTDNSAGFGVGTDSEYAETSSGKDISFSSVSARYVRFYTNGSTANQYNHYVEAEIYGNFSAPPTPTPIPTAKLLFTFDDGSIDNLTVAAPILKAKGFKGTAYVIKNTATHPDSMDISDLNSLYKDYGWDIGNHTANHYGLPTDKSNNPAPTLADLETSYLDNQNWILANGWTRGAYHVAYPYGDYNAELINYLKTIGVLTARQAWGGTQSMPVSNFYLINSKAVNDSNIAVIKSQIDNAVSTGSTLFLTFHDIKNYTGTYNVSPSNFQSLVNYVSNYVQQSKLDVMTISEWYDSVK